jgi:hypothetical protein
MNRTGKNQMQWWSLCLSEVLAQELPATAFAHGRLSMGEKEVNFERLAAIKIR